MERARREWEGVEGRNLPEKIHTRALEIAERKARDLHLVEQWDEWQRQRGRETREEGDT